MLEHNACPQLRAVAESKDVAPRRDEIANMGSHADLCRTPHNLGEALPCDGDGRLDGSSDEDHTGSAGMSNVDGSACSHEARARA